MTVRIVAMTAAEIDRCAELEEILFPGDSPWPASAFASELAGIHNRYFVARRTIEGVDEMVGYAGVSLLGTIFTPESEVHTIGVDPKCHRAGIGSLLLRELLGAADKHGGPVFLEVRTDNVAAIELYRRFGFETVGTRKRYYQPSGADAYTMVRPARGRSAR